MEYRRERFTNQPLVQVVCGLIKIVQRARRGRHLAADLKQWKQEQERILGEALLNKRPHPTLTPWLASSKTNLAAGDFFLSEDPHGGVAA
jgi:hypothetical protein